MPLSATLTRNVGGENASKAPSLPSAGSNTIPNHGTSDSKSAPFSATEALQAALTSRYASSAALRAQWQPSETGAATAALEASSSQQQVVMSTIGFGIDLGHNRNSSWNATEASVRALRDAMERSTLRLPFLATLSDKQLELHVKLGVPPRNDLHPTDPMLVDVAAITAILPQSIPLGAPIQVVVGGLSVPGPAQGDEPPVCAAIASVSITASPSDPVATSMESWSQLASVEETKPPAKPQPTKASHSPPGRVDSMSMLARISSAVRDNPSIVAGNGDTPLAAAVAAVEMAGKRKDSMDTFATASTEASSQAEQPRQKPKRKIRAKLSAAATSRADESPSPPKHRLRPGLTTKKNTRQFVEHDYHDHANDTPLPGETATGPLDVDNVPFPYKMYDTLARIESDGYGDVMSWMPHGRSFKIHNLESFNDHVLPMYFRQSKKSSLLRQLNLYGFRRISVGPDKGSYYHELFLRGKRFLAGRMRRCKVNGKRIRSAGNPETEPHFWKMDPMPMEKGPILHIHTVSSDVSEEDEDHDEHGNHDGPVSYKSLSFPNKLHSLLDLLEVKGDTSIISWLPHGRSFRVNDPEALVTYLLPRFFGMSKLSSFHRQLLQYGFHKSSVTSPDKGAYYHSSFIRGMPRLCREMIRCSIIRDEKSAQGPDFFSMPTIPSVQAGLLELPLDMPALPVLTGN